MRLCSYVVVHDYGFAPNPHGNACTLAACTPNHQGLRMKAGDWIVGNSSVDQGQRLVYAMCVSEVLDFDDYFRDPRFQHKKPTRASRESMCGDNIYFRDDSGEWKQAETSFHSSPEFIRKDVRHPRVFIADEFYYFGENAPPFPAEFGGLIATRQGCRCNHPAEVAEAFVAWLRASHAPGRHGLPRDGHKPVVPAEDCGSCTPPLHEPGTPTPKRVC